MKKVVLKLDYHDVKARKKVMKTVSGHSGVVSIAMEAKEMKLTVTGDIDPVTLVSKLRKLCSVDILSVEALKAPEKKKEEPKKEDPKKDDKKDSKDDLAKLMQAYEAYHMNIQYPTVTPFNYNPHFYVRPVEEEHNACVIS